MATAGPNQREPTIGKVLRCLGRMTAKGVLVVVEDLDDLGSLFGLHGDGHARQHRCRRGR